MRRLIIGGLAALALAVPATAGAKCQFLSLQSAANAVAAAVPSPAVPVEITGCVRVTRTRVVCSTEAITAAFTCTQKVTVRRYANGTIGVRFHTAVCTSEGPLGVD